jgi:hypothetical protein
MMMEYGETATQSTLGYAARDQVGVHPGDLSSIRSMLANLVERAVGLGYRVESVGDIVYGPRPVASTATLNSSPETVVPLAELVKRLDGALDRIASGLDRL